MFFGVTNEECDSKESRMINKGEVYTVMSTTVKIISKYIIEHPNINMFEYTREQSEKEQSKNRNVRLALYNRYIEKVFDKDGGCYIY